MNYAAIAWTFTLVMAGNWLMCVAWEHGDAYWAMALSVLLAGMTATYEWALQCLKRCFEQVSEIADDLMRRKT